MQSLGSAKLALAVIAIATRCGACSVSLIHNPAQVGPNFRVLVQDRGKPIEGFEVEIHGKQTGVISSVADGNGFAFFRGVPPGSYRLTSRVEEGIFSGMELEAKPEGPPDATITFHWPSGRDTLVLTRSLKGTMRQWGDPRQPEPHLTLDLLEARSGQKIKSLQTNEQGEFDFEIDASGRYYLSPKLFDGGVIPLVVDPGAPADHLDLDLAYTSCGLSYLQRPDCPQTDLRLAQLSGDVVDPAGAAIPNAKIYLFDTVHLVEQLTSDSTGEFTAKGSRTGAFLLGIDSPGFTSLRGTLVLEPTLDARPLSVQLGVLGTCSSAHLR